MNAEGSCLAACPLQPCWPEGVSAQTPGAAPSIISSETAIPTKGRHGHRGHAGSCREDSAGPARAHPVVHGRVVRRGQPGGSRRRPLDSAGRGSTRRDDDRAVGRPAGGGAPVAVPGRSARGLRSLRPDDLSLLRPELGGDHRLPGVHLVLREDRAAQLRQHGTAALHRLGAHPARARQRDPIPGLAADPARARVRDHRRERDPSEGGDPAVEGVPELHGAARKGCGSLAGVGEPAHQPGRHLWCLRLRPHAGLVVAVHRDPSVLQRADPCRGPAESHGQDRGRVGGGELCAGSSTRCAPGWAMPSTTSTGCTSESTRTPRSSRTSVPTCCIAG